MLRICQYSSAIVERKFRFIYFMTCFRRLSLNTVSGVKQLYVDALGANVLVS